MGLEEAGGARGDGEGEVEEGSGLVVGVRGSGAGVFEEGYLCADGSQCMRRF